MEKERVECIFPVGPWLHDHAVDGRIILPAVVALEWLARIVAGQYPDCRVTTMEAVRFPRFAELLPDRDRMECVVELAPLAGGRVLAQLCTRKRLGRMTRLLEHARAVFGGEPAPPVPVPRPSAVDNTLAAAGVYRDRVPFGPRLHSLIGTLALGPDQARGRVRALTHGRAGLLGSPFPLDGAMHAACVLGQELVDHIPFPVGCARRVIHRATQPGHEYDVHVRLTGREGSELCFDLALFAGDGNLETVTGLIMRDVGL